MGIRTRILVSGAVACLVGAGGAAGADGPISTFAGTIGGFAGDGAQATSALLNRPEGMAVAADGTVLIADAQNHRVRKVASNGVITTIVGNGTPDLGGDGGPAPTASLDTPNHLVRKPRDQTIIYYGFL